MDPTTQVLVILGCLVLSAFFSGSETALLRLRLSDLDGPSLAAHNPAIVAARSLLGATSRLLVTILVGNNVVNLLAAALASAMAVRYLGEAVGVPLATGLLAILVLVFAEVLPKAFSARHPQRVVQVVALPLYLLHQMLRPVHVLFDRLVEPMVRWLGGGAEREHASTAEDLLRLARAARLESGTPTPASIIGGVARAAEMQVADILVPRAEVVAFPIETTPAELLERVLEERYTRVPIYEGSIDHVLGVIHLKDLITAVREGAADLHGILKPVLRVPERKEILSLLADMQRAFAHLAIVKDEFGVTLGLVTQEDILEEIVGEIRDEFDREELLTIRPVGDAYQAVGRLKVIDFNRETGWTVPAERGDTLSGLVFNLLGRAPRKGDAVAVPGYEITVVDVSGSRITQVRVARREEQTEEGDRGTSDPR